MFMNCSLGCLIITIIYGPFNFGSDTTFIYLFKIKQQKWNSILLCGPGWLASGTHFVDQSDLKLTEIC